jgi:hypothetical protein
LFVVLFLLRFEARPGRFFIGLGVLLGLAGLVVSLYIAYLRLRYGTIFSRFPLLALGLGLLVVGGQVFSLGLFAELLAYLFRSRRPLEPVVWESGPRSGAGAPRGPREVSGAWPGERVSP